MIYHDEYIVESFSTTTKQNYYIYQVISKSGKMKRGLSQINNALRLYLWNQRVVEYKIDTRQSQYPFWLEFYSLNITGPADISYGHHSYNIYSGL